MLSRHKNKIFFKLKLICYAKNRGLVMLIADKDDELLEVLNENGEPTGRFEKRSIVHANKMYHNEVALWVIDKANQRVLLQRRSPNKKQNPNKLALCAGHVVGNETLLVALQKEAKEEIGVDIKQYGVKKIVTIKRTEPNNYCFSHHYYILQYIPINELKIQKEELSEVLYLDYNKLKEMVKNNSSEVVFSWNAEYQKLFNLLDEIICK